MTRFRWCRTLIDNARWIPLPEPVPGSCIDWHQAEAPKPWHGGIIERGPLVSLDGKPDDPADMIESAS